MGFNPIASSRNRRPFRHPRSRRFLQKPKLKEGVGTPRIRARREFPGWRHHLDQNPPPGPIRVPNADVSRASSRPSPSTSSGRNMRTKSAAWFKSPRTPPNASPPTIPRPGTKRPGNCRDPKARESENSGDQPRQTRPSIKHRYIISIVVIIGSPIASRREMPPIDRRD